MSYNHSIYGPNRHCRTCKQHFASIHALKFHTMSYKCPGEPVHYSTTTGRLYYRGDSIGSFCSADLFPRTRSNTLIGRGQPYERYVESVAIDEPLKNDDVMKEVRTRLPSGLYKERVYNPRYPRVLEGTCERIGPEDPKDRTELNRLCGSRRYPPRRVSLVTSQRLTNQGKLRVVFFNRFYLIWTSYFGMFGLVLFKYFILNIFHDNFNLLCYRYSS